MRPGGDGSSDATYLGHERVRWIVSSDAKPAKVMGPASYFPSMEKKYGRPIGEWLDLVRARPADEKHMQTVDWLKAEFAMGHGHANALVAYVRGRRDPG